MRKQPSGYLAAIPLDLPPNIEPTWDLFDQLSEADRAVSELAGAGRNLPNPHLLIAPFMRREAVLSSRIEGTQASLSDLLLFEASQEKEQRTNDVREVANYIRALEYGLNRLTELPLSLRMFTELHEILIADPTKTPGQLRTSQNWIGPPGCSLADATYVPPPPEQMKEAISSLERFIHKKTAIPPLLKYALIHYQFEAIHPFLDGNGRLGRLLITLLLCADPTRETPLLPLPLLYLSAFFEQRRHDYYAHLLSVSQNSTWDSWFKFFLEGVVEQSRDGVRRADRIGGLILAFKEQLRIARGSALTFQIVESLLVKPVVGVSELSRRFERTPAGIQTAIDKLVSIGILTEVTGRKRGRLYACWEIVRAIE